MNKLIAALKSRTFWTVVLLASLNTVPQLEGQFDESTIDIVNVILTALAGYFRVTPRA
jgi:hypothetical protein